jgi:hypothetical protein
VSLLASSILILTFVPGARLPSLKAASISRRLALAPDGRAYVDVANEPNSWTDAVDRDYAPPQIRAPHMMKRSRSVLNARRELDSMVPHRECHTHTPVTHRSRPRSRTRLDSYLVACLLTLRSVESRPPRA